MINFGSLDAAAAPGVALNNIEFDFGDFISKYVGEIMGPIANALQPIQPVLNFLNTEVPIFNRSLINFVASIDGGEQCRMSRSSWIS